MDTFWINEENAYLIEDHFFAMCLEISWLIFFSHSFSESELRIFNAKICKVYEKQISILDERVKFNLVF